MDKMKVSNLLDCNANLKHNVQKFFHENSFNSFCALSLLPSVSEKNFESGRIIYSGLIELQNLKHLEHYLSYDSSCFVKYDDNRSGLIDVLKEEKLNDIILKIHLSENNENEILVTDYKLNFEKLFSSFSIRAVIKRKDKTLYHYCSKNLNNYLNELNDDDKIILRNVKLSEVREGMIFE